MEKTKVTEEQIIDAIVNFFETYNYSPSYDDLLEVLPITSKSTLNFKLNNMRDKGVVHFVDKSPRTITLPNYKYTRCK